MVSGALRFDWLDGRYVESVTEEIRPATDEDYERFNEACAGAGDFLDARTRYQAAYEDSEEPQAHLLWAPGYLFIPRSSEERRDNAGGAFGAMAEIDGFRFPPRIQDVGEEAEETWAAAFDRATSPLGRCRLGDLLWERKRGERPDLYARAAADAYLAFAPQTDRAMERVWALSRSVELATMVGDDDRRQAATSAILAAAREELALVDERRPGITLSLLRDVIDQGLGADHSEIAELLDRSWERYADDPYQAESIEQLRMQLATPEETQELRRAQVRNWREAAEQGDGMMRLIRLQRAMELARLHGLTDEEAELRVEIQEIDLDSLGLKAIGHEIEIPADDLDAAVSEIVGDESTAAALDRFGHEGPPTGDPAGVQEDVRARMAEFPLSHLIPRVVTVPGFAGTLFRAATPEDHERLQQAEHMKLQTSLWGVFAARVLDGIRERWGPIDREELAAFFSSDVIDAELADRFARGLELYWEGQFDEAAHLVAPRLEAAIRELARRARIPVLKEPEGDKPGGVRALRPLIDALADRFDEGSAEYLERWRVYLRQLLVDELGMNLRNVIAHGLAPAIGRHDAALLVHAACFLTTIRFTEGAADEASED
jgi:hypothetical protein